MEGLSGREAADAMQLSEKAFESLLIRARSALKRAVEQSSMTVGGSDDFR
jgi:RNA polymerase sigma-70 factor (ECF subfamily)